MDSIEELELAIDAMQGINEDGTAMEGDNLAREARVRSAYLDWCKTYDKSPDESRFSQFYENFLEMEEYAKASGKEMVLNEYADYTKEEYEKLQSSVEEEREAESAKKAEEAAAEAKEAAAKVAAEKEAAAKAAEEKAAAVLAEAEAKKKAEEERKRKEREEAGKYFAD
jgi:dTMP kinase